jgi:hypothetical protein
LRDRAHAAGPINFLKLDEGALVDIDLADGMGHLLSRDRLTVYFKRRGREKAKALIDAWKAEGVYPYPDHVWLRTKRPHDRKWLLATARAVAWLVLTKRPENIERMLPSDWEDGYSNVWLGTTAEYQTRFDLRWKTAKALSLEPPGSLLARADEGI